MKLGPGPSVSRHGHQATGQGEPQPPQATSILSSERGIFSFSPELMSPCKGHSHRVCASLKSRALGSLPPSSRCCREGLPASHRGHSATRPLLMVLLSSWSAGWAGHCWGPCLVLPQSLPEYKLKPVKLGLPIRAFDIPNDYKAAKEWPETGHKIHLPIPTLSWSDVTLHYQQVFLGKCKT